MLAQNAEDFRSEWVHQCGSGQSLSGRTVRLQSAYPELNGALCAIFRAHGAVISEDNAQYLVALDAEPAPKGEPVLAVCTGDSAANDPSWMILRSPQIYGAGLPAGCGCNDEVLSGSTGNFIHCTQLFRYILAALAEFCPGSLTVPAEDPHREDHLQALRLLYAHPKRRFYDDTSYGGKLRQMQLAQLELLLELDRICKKHNIRYFLGGGTLLGAVRHKGFIPWDDDIDVMMPRQDFDRFTRIAPTETDPRYFYQDSRTDPDYHSPFPKLRKNGTKFTTEFSSRFPNSHNGIFLDIFAHDAAPKPKLLLKAHIFATKFARSLVFNKWAETPMHFYGRLKLICRIAEWFKHRCTIAQLERFERFVMTFWNKKKTAYLYDGMGMHLDHGHFDAAILDETIDYEFEGHWFPIPKRYDEYLRFSYGDDYMRWPHPAQRNSHHAAVEFSLGDDGQ